MYVDPRLLTRLIVVHDEQGRVLDMQGVDVQLMVQDEGRTLKVFTYTQDRPKEKK